MPTGPRRTWSDRGEAADDEERRHALPKMFAFVLWGWLAFGLLDLYIAFVVAPARRSAGCSAGASRARFHRWSDGSSRATAHVSTR